MKPNYGCSAGLVLSIICFSASQTFSAFGAEYLAATNRVSRTVPPLILSGKSSKEGNSKISSPVTDVLNLLDAKVSPSVIKAFIKNLPMAYNPTAAELIELTERGASTDILVDLLQRGAEVMARSPQVQPIGYYQLPAPAATYVPEPEPPVVESPPFSETDSQSVPSDSSHTETIILGGAGPGFPPPSRTPRHPRERGDQGRPAHPAAPGQEAMRSSGPPTAAPSRPPPPPASAPQGSRPAPSPGFGGRPR